MLKEWTLFSHGREIENVEKIEVMGIYLAVFLLTLLKRIKIAYVCIYACVCVCIYI